MDMQFFVVLGSMTANLILAIIILIHLKRSLSGKYLFFIVLSLSGWTLSNYYSNLDFSYDILLWLNRSIFLSTTIFAWSFLLFSESFPGETLPNKKLFNAAMASLFFVSFLSMSPFLARSIVMGEDIVDINFGWGVFFYGFFVLGCFIYSAIRISVKFFRENEPILKLVLRLLIWGVSIFLFLGITTNFIVPLVFNQFGLTVLTPFYATGFCLIIFYAILKYQFLDIKLITSQILIIAVWFAVSFQFFFTDTQISRFITGFALVVTVILGIMLFKSIKKEIAQKEALEIANTELQKADQTKNEFINIASHQLRTPITVIRGTISMLQDGTMDSFDEATKNKFYDGAMFKCKKLEEIINDILNATSLTNRKFSVMKRDMEKINIRDFFERLISGFKPEVMERNIDLSIGELDENVLEFFGQRQFLEEVFSNLITNAIKYSPSSKLTPEIYATRVGKASIVISSRKKGGNVIFSVRDNGIGIPEETIPELFQKFVRAQNAKNIYPDGTGLGLYIVREIIEGHGGKVWVESELGKGSEFFIKLPINPKKEVDIEKYIRERAAMEM